MRAALHRCLQLAGLALAGTVFGIWLIRTLRSKAYNRWHPILRWAFLGVGGTLVGMIVVGILFAAASSLNDTEPKPFPVGVVGALVIRVLINVLR